MIQARRCFRCRGLPQAMPGIQANMMVVTTCGKERRLVSVALSELESEHIAIERKCPIKISHFQMNMSDADPGVNWLWLFLLHRER